MAKKKTTEEEKAAEAAKPKRVIVRAKDASAWRALLTKAEDEHWRVLRVELQVIDRLLAGKPASLDAANAMLKARGLEDLMVAAADIADPTARQEAGDKIAKDEGLCEFNRRADKPGIWMPSNNLKAMLKENWSVIGKRVAVRGSRGALAEGMFVVGTGEGHEEKDWIYLGEKPDGVYTAVAHTTGPQGPMSSIKRHEFVTKPLLTFDIKIANAESVLDKISDDDLADTLVHGQDHGAGACRSQGFGKFKVVNVYEIERN